MLAAFKSLSERFMQKVMMLYLEQDAEYYQDLRGLFGKEILFYVRDLHVLSSFQFTRTEIKVMYRVHHEIPVMQDDKECLCLVGRSIDLLAFAFLVEQRSYLLNKGLIEYQGDLFLLEALVKLFKERHFLENVLIPGSMKVLLLKSIKSASVWQRRNVEALRGAFLDYVSEELGLIPSAKHFELVQEELLSLDGSLDRLEAKVDVLFGD